MIKITFPDGSVREYESGVTPLQIAESISSRLAQDILCASVNDRIVELNQMYGAYTANEAHLDHCVHMLGIKTDNMEELTYATRKRIHNLKYYTWVEQQGETVEDLNALWYDTEGTWDAVHHQAKELDELINAFNEESGVLGML